MSSGMFDAVLDSASELERGLEEQAAEIVRENDNVLIDMNTENLREGKTSTGSKISPGYFSEDYATMKHDMNPRPGYGVPDLFFEGDFQEDFFIRNVEGGWESDSNNEKRDMLVSKYGDEILGNTSEDEQEFNEEYILPELIEWTTATLNEKL